MSLHPHNFVISAIHGDASVSEDHSRIVLAEVTIMPCLIGLMGAGKVCKLHLSALAVSRL